MSTKKEAWGIEVGAQAIKAMKLGRSGNGVVLLDFDCMPFKQVLTTPDLNVEEAIRVNLDALATKHEFDKSTVVVSVPGHMAFARFAKLPPIESSKVKSIVAYEAQQQIPFPIDEVEWDYQVFAQEDAPDIEVGIFAITKERVAKFLSNYRSVGLRVDLLTLSPVAVYNAFANENAGGTGHGSGTVYLDIGTTSTDIIVVEDETIWLRTLPLGGNHFTQSLMKQFKISFAKAEKLKLEAATSKYAKQIYQAMRGVFNDLVTEIERSLGFYTSLNRDAELTQIVGVGSTWKLPGLQKYIKQNTRMQVIRPDGFAQLEVEDRRAAEFSSVAVNMATAYGLALQGLGMGVVDANVLPQSVLKQRMWKAKQPWIIAAAACVAGAAALGPATQFLESQSFNGAWNASRDDITSTIAEAQEAKNTYDTVQTSDPRPGIRNYRRSFDYANLYTGLYEDVTTAMATIEPHPAYKDLDWDNAEAVKKAGEVPRRQRDQIWVKSVTTEYLPPVAAIVEDFGASGSGEFDGSMEGELTPPPPSTGGALALGSGPGEASLQPVPVPTLPENVVSQDPETGSEAPPPDPLEGLAASPAPRIIVTVSGETTMNGAEISRVLNQKVVDWMKTNAIRADRPYIILPELKDPRFSPRPTTNIGGGGTGFGGAAASADALTPEPTPEDTSTPPAGGIPGGGGGFTPPGGGFGVTGATADAKIVEVKTPEGWYAKLGTTSGGFALDALYPRRLLSTEKRDGDYKFTFKFEVILHSPDEARKTILAPKPQENDPAQESPESESPSPTAANKTQEDQA
ncbi:MAG: type IV pilus assembly protein PilM [Phycisphaeraceae bacterium]